MTLAGNSAVAKIGILGEKRQNLYRACNRIRMRCPKSRNNHPLTDGCENEQIEFSSI